MDAKEFINGIGFLTKAYNKEMDKATIEVWFTFFKDAEYKDFMAACVRLIKRERFMPTIADITGELAMTHNPSLQLNADAEWSKVDRAIVKYGYYNAGKGMKSLDPYTQEVVRRLGGFRHLCLSTNPDWDRKNFIQTFNGMQKADREMLSYTPKLLTTEEKKRLEEIRNKQMLLLEN